MAANFGWIELVLFYGVALVFIAWQYVSVSRTLEKTRAERIAREAEEAKAEAGAEERAEKTASEPE